MKTPEEDRVDNDERYSLHGNDVVANDTSTQRHSPLNDDAAEVLARARLRRVAHSNEQPRQFGADALMKRKVEERLSIQAPPAPPVRPKNHQLHSSLILDDNTLCFGTVVRYGNSVGFIRSQDLSKDIIFYINDLPQGMVLPSPKSSETVSFQVARRRHDADQLVAVFMKVVDVGSMINSIMQLKMKNVDPVVKRPIEFNADFMNSKPAAVIYDTNNDFDIEFRPLKVEPRTIEETMAVASEILRSSMESLRENARGPRDRIEEVVWSKMEHLSLRAITLMYRIMESTCLIDGMFTKQPMDVHALGEAGVYDLQIATEEGIVTDKAG